ncbi:MmcQ/YjbR family DNA-binding protein [Pelagibacterium halotolerans]|uniref:MmcQ/YjbR family DNA-binding protein n=1 Tax=Pelagibacterium halotolerans TaxID=531813 RepID=UPI00384BD2D7
MTFDDIRRIALKFPGVVDATSYDTPAIKVGTQFLLRERDPGIVAMRCASIDDRDLLIETGEDAFFITDHYRDYPYVLIRLETLDPARFTFLFEAIWRQKALQKHLKAYEDTRGS